MHPSAYFYSKLFFNNYVANSNVKILEIGSQNVNGTIRDNAPAGAEYIGVDFISGQGVDVVLEDPYILPFRDNNFDVVVCSSVLEHSEFFWLLILEIFRVMNNTGRFYLNTPSNGYIHRYPVDCWRFYPDAAQAFVSWGRKNGYNLKLAESFFGSTDYKIIEYDCWTDYVAVIVKDGYDLNLNKNRICDTLKDATNCRINNGVNFVDSNATSLSNDHGEINRLLNSNKLLLSELSFLKVEKDKLEKQLQDSEIQIVEFKSSICGRLYSLFGGKK